MPHTHKTTNPPTTVALPETNNNIALTTVTVHDSVPSTSSTADTSKTVAINPLHSTMDVSKFFNTKMFSDFHHNIRSRSLTGKRPAGIAEWTPTSSVSIPPSTKRPDYFCGLAGTTILFLFISAILVILVAVGFGRPKQIEQVETVRTVEMPFWPPSPAENGDAIWTYDLHLEDGPYHWGEIRKLSDNTIAYPDCDGHQQSPIDLPAFPSTGISSPIIGNYPPETMQIVSRPGGHPGFQVKYTNSNPIANITVDGEIYNFVQFHYHSPSEHTVNGQYFPLEVHFVHQKVGSTGTNDLAVFGILYNFTADGTHNAALNEFWFEIHHVNPSISGILIQEMYNQMGPVYQRYNGSLTTPPCSETVKWHVAVSTVGVNQLQKIVYQYALNGINNYRPTLPLYNRTVVAYAK